MVAGCTDPVVARCFCVVVRTRQFLPFAAYYFEFAVGRRVSLVVVLPGRANSALSLDAIVRRVECTLPRDRAKCQTSADRATAEVVAPAERNIRKQRRERTWDVDLTMLVRASSGSTRSQHMRSAPRVRTLAPGQPAAEPRRHSRLAWKLGKFMIKVN